MKIGFIHINYVQILKTNIAGYPAGYTSYPAGYTSYPARYRIAKKLPDSAEYQIVAEYPALPYLKHLKKLWHKVYCYYPY